MSLTFITNRTLNDVSFAKQNQGDVSFLLGSMNYTDLNRIESNTKVLADKLKEYGYIASIEVRPTTWTINDVPFLDDINRIRNNVNLLQTAFYSLPDWRNIIINSVMSYEQLNALEWDLERIDLYLQDVITAFDLKQSGTLFVIAGGVLN